MTDAYLQSLGFVPLPLAPGPVLFQDGWRYQAPHNGQDGTRLFIEHPYAIDRCRLSSVVAPFGAADIVAQVALHDRPGLEAAIAAFYAAHGGIGAAVVPVVPFDFRPYRQQR